MQEMIVVTSHLVTLSFNKQGPVQTKMDKLDLQVLLIKDHRVQAKLQALLHQLYLIEPNTVRLSNSYLYLMFIAGQ